jgi:membrane protein
MLSKFSPTRLVIWADTTPSGQSPARKVLHTLCRIFLLTLQGFRKNELALRAAALTFTVMLSLVPILAMSTAVLKGLGGSDELKSVVYSYVASLERDRPPQNRDEMEIPEGMDETNSSLTQHLHSAVDRLFDYVDRTNFTTLGTIGVAGLLLSVVLVLGNIEMAMNAIWHVESGRSVMRKISDYLALVVLMPISVNIGLAASAVLMNETLLAKFSIVMPMAWIQALILKLIPVFFITLTLYVIYLFFPNTKVKTIPAMIGALFAGFFWFEIQNLYIGLQIGVAKYNAIYGSFATLPLFLVWIYFGWIFILLGAQIAFAYQNKDALRLTDIDIPPSLKLAVAFDILDYVYTRFDEEKAATITDFSERYPMHNLILVRDTFDVLKISGLLHRTADNTSIKPSIPQGKLEQGKIIKAVIGSTYSDTSGGRKSSRVLKAAAAPPAGETVSAERETKP